MWRGVMPEGVPSRWPPRQCCGPLSTGSCIYRLATSLRQARRWPVGPGRPARRQFAACRAAGNPPRPAASSRLQAARMSQHAVPPMAVWHKRPSDSASRFCIVSISMDLVGPLKEDCCEWKHHRDLIQLSGSIISVSTNASMFCIEADHYKLTNSLRGDRPMRLRRAYPDIARALLDSIVYFHSPFEFRHRMSCCTLYVLSALLPLPVCLLHGSGRLSIPLPPPFHPYANHATSF